MISAKLILKAFALLAFMIAQKGNDVKSESNDEYAVIIDGGSTSSRVLAYHFIVKDGTVNLASPEHYRKTTPGLSEYLDNPSKGVLSIKTLLRTAKHSFVPDSFWGSTIISVRLTAGLRGHRGQDVATLLEKLKTAVDEFGFESNENSVDFLNGEDEARFLWFTVNFLTGRLASNLNNTTAVIDLSGGSVEVAYIPRNLELNTKYIKQYVVMGQLKQMYCNCFQDMGLISGRKSTFVNAKGNPANIVTSICIHQNVINISFKFNHEFFIVSGASTTDGSIDYQSCKSFIEDVVSRNITDKPEDLQNQKVVAISYFFDRAKDNSLVDDKGGEITVQMLYGAAKNECNKVYDDTTCPYKCLDYTYIAVLLDKGFGLTTLEVLGRVNDHEISWSLGAAYDLLQKKRIKHPSNTNK